MTETDELPDPSTELEAEPPLIEGIHLAVTDQQTLLDLDPKFLNRVTESLLLDEGITHADISLAVVDDSEIHEINRQYLHHDYPTDVISFLLTESRQAGPIRIEGEVVISSETAVRSADEYGCSPQDEFTLYLVHGLLHLCGYDDQTDSDCKIMRTRERMHLQKFGIEPHY